MATVFVTFSVTTLAFLGLWLLSLRLKDASVIDFYWGPGFAVIGWSAWAMAGTSNPYQLILLAALTLWGLRLGWFILQRHNGEDARYAAMRAHHGDAFGRISLWLVFGLQAVVQWLASSPVLVTMLAPTSPVLAIFIAGLMLFCAGFVLEMMADAAVARFKADPANKGKLLRTGLYARIRHPNYLGEILLQLGIGLMAFGLTQNLLAFAGPLLMAGLIMRLSGVPMLEEQLSKREGFAEWKARSGALWPRL
jgi:steroid 5-alpha reductase family enzyme